MMLALLVHFSAGVIAFNEEPLSFFSKVKNEWALPVLQRAELLKRGSG